MAIQDSFERHPGGVQRLIVIRARNVNEALPMAVRLLLTEGRKEETRNGPAVVATEPVTIVYEQPRQRVLLSPERDANPFLHAADALWCMAGRDDVEFPAFFAEQIRAYSDDGLRLRGAYGKRWRSAFGLDQIHSVIHALRERPGCRRQVVQMFSAELDLGVETLDTPCNLFAHFQIREGAMEMLVAQRSGDALWGVMGANVVQFGFLHEYIATAVGVPLGVHRHAVSNFHAYLEPLERCRELASYKRQEQAYPPATQPLFYAPDEFEAFDAECRLFCDWALGSAFRLHFFREVAVPMRDAYRAYKGNEKPGAFAAAHGILAEMAHCDWRLAAEQWIDRREQRWKAKQERKGIEP